MISEIDAFYWLHYFVLTCFLNKVFSTSNIKACQLNLYILFLIWDLPIFAIPIRQIPNNISATGSESKIRILLLLNKMTIKKVIDIINFIIGNLTILSVKKFIKQGTFSEEFKAFDDQKLSSGQMCRRILLWESYLPIDCKSLHDTWNFTLNIIRICGRKANLDRDRIFKIYELANEPNASRDNSWVFYINWSKNHAKLNSGA